MFSNCYTLESKSIPKGGLLRRQSDPAFIPKGADMHAPYSHMDHKILLGFYR